MDMKLLEGMNKKKYIGGIKITVAKDMRDARESLYQDKIPMSKEVNRKMCEMLYQSIG